MTSSMQEAKQFAFPQYNASMCMMHSHKLRIISKSSKCSTFCNKTPYWCIIADFDVRKMLITFG